MSHKNAPPIEPEQLRMQDWYNKNKEQGTHLGWGRSENGSYLAIFSRLAWAAWQEAQKKI